MTPSKAALQFTTESWAVFNLHVNSAGQRAMAICRLRFTAEDEGMQALELAYKTGIMVIFHSEPNLVTSLFANACFIFANGLCGDGHADIDG